MRFRSFNPPLRLFFQTLFLLLCIVGLLTADVPAEDVPAEDGDAGPGQFSLAELEGRWKVRCTVLYVDRPTTAVMRDGFDFARFEIQKSDSGYIINVTPGPLATGQPDTRWSRTWPVTVENGRVVLDFRRIVARPAWICDVDRLDLIPARDLKSMRGFAAWSTGFSTAEAAAAGKTLRARGVTLNTFPFWGARRTYFTVTRDGNAPGRKLTVPETPSKPASVSVIFNSSPQVAAAITVPTIEKFRKDAARWLAGRGFDVIEPPSKEADYHLVLAPLGEKLGQSAERAGVVMGNNVISIAGALSAQSVEVRLVRPPARRPLLRAVVSETHQTFLPDRVPPEKLFRSGQWFVYGDPDRLKLQRSLLNAALTAAFLQPPRQRKNAPPTRLDEILLTGR